MTTQRLNIFVLTAIILCGVLFCTNLHARVCFVTEGDCAVDGGNFSNQNYENDAKNKCKELGYEKEECGDGQITYNCPYSTKWKKCCGLEYKYSSCSGALVSKGTCNGKHKCVCDADIYKCAFNNDDVSGVDGVKKCGSSDYPNSVPGGGSCVQEVLNNSGNALIPQTLFKKCICGSYYGLTENDCKNSSVYKNAEPSGEKCKDSDGVEWYPDCYCDRSNTSKGYPYSEDDCYPYRPDTADFCRVRGSVYYKRCLNCDGYPAQNLDNVAIPRSACNTDTVPTTPLNNNATDALGQIERHGGECTHYYCPNKKNAPQNTGPYKIMRCQVGYRVSTGDDYKLDENFEKICEQSGSNGNCVKYAKYKEGEACIPVDCSEAVKYVLKSKNLTSYALFDGTSLRNGDGNEITNNNLYTAVVADDLTITEYGRNVESKSGKKLYHVLCSKMKICYTAPGYSGCTPATDCNAGFGGSTGVTRGYTQNCTVEKQFPGFTTRCGSTVFSIACDSASTQANGVLNSSGCCGDNCKNNKTAKCVECTPSYDYTYTYTYKGLAGVRAMKYVSGDEFRKLLGLTEGSLEDNMLRRSCPIVRAPTITYKGLKFPVLNDDINHKTVRGERQNTGSEGDIPTMEFHGIHLKFDSITNHETGTKFISQVFRKLHIKGGDLIIDAPTKFNKELWLDTLSGYESKVFVNANMTLKDAILSTGYSFEGDSRMEILMPNTNLLSGFGSFPYKYKFIFNSGQYFKVKHFQIGAQGGYQPRDDKFPFANAFGGKIPFVGPTSGEEAKVMTEAFLGWTGWLNSSGYATETYSQVRGVRVELHNKIKWYLQDESDINKKYLLGLSSGSKLTVYPETNTNARIFRGANSNWKECEMANEVTYQRHYVGDVGKCHCDYSSKNEDDTYAFIACTVDKDDTHQSINYATETIISSRGHQSGWNNCANRNTSISNSCQIIYQKCKDYDYSGYPSVELLTCQ